MSKSIILIDYDDVIVDWASPACETMGVDLTHPEKRHQIETVWGGIDAYVSEAELWEKIHSEGADWWENLPVLPWGRRLYDEMSKLGEVCFLTAPSDHPSCAAGKVASIKKHFDTRNYLIGRPKYLCASKNKILVDDRPSNCEKFIAAGGQAFQWPNALKLLRIGGWDRMVDRAVDFVKHIDTLLEMTPSMGDFTFHCIPELEDAENKV